MYLSTTFGSKESHIFDHLLFIQSDTCEILFSTLLTDNSQTINFFEKLVKFHKKIKNNNSLKELPMQFAVSIDNQITPICWFDLHLNNNCIISRDYAFNVTLLKKNGINIPLGRFFTKKKHPLNREFNIKINAYKYIKNQIRKN